MGTKTKKTGKPTPKPGKTTTTEQKTLPESIGTLTIDSIKLNDSNPRFIKDEAFNKLCDSIKEFPEMMELRPIIVDENNVTIGGNMRLRALKHLGYREIPVKWVKRAKDLTPEQKREFVIKDNLAYGEWDWDSLANNWELETLAGWGMDIPEAYLDGMPDVENVLNFTEGANFIVNCENLEELNALQAKLGITHAKVSAATFYEILDNYRDKED